MQVPGRESVKDFIIGPGMVGAKSPIKNTQFIGIDEESMASMLTERVFYPGEIVEQPLGPGTTIYDHHNVTQMLFDLIPYSQYDEPFDPLQLLSQDPTASINIKGEVINTIVPASFKGDVFHDIGDYYTYCIKTQSSKRM